MISKSDLDQFAIGVADVQMLIVGGLSNESQAQLLRTLDTLATGIKERGGSDVLLLPYERTRELLRMLIQEREGREAARLEHVGNGEA